jgi:hypothetical protein
MDGQQNSPLFCLPAELRNNIYAYALTQQRPIEVERASSPSPNDPDCRIRFKTSHTGDAMPHRRFAQLLHLSQVCCQIRAETMDLVYVLNIFALEVEYIKDFVGTLPDYARKVVKKMVVRTTHHQYPHILELCFHRLRKIFKALARLPALRKIFLPNYTTTGLGVEKWEEAIWNNAGMRVEVVIVKERIVRVETGNGVELALQTKYW